MTKVALLHYWLTNMRGGENVLAEFCQLYPESDIFTHAWNPQKVKEPFNKHRIHESFIAKLPRGRQSCQKYLPLMPWAIKRFDLNDYDLILSSESGPIKGLKKRPGAIHVCYCHTPMRYLWDMYQEYYDNTNIIGKIGMRVFRDFLRKYDLASANSVDYFIANSRFVADRIKRIYKRDAAVIYPPVNCDFFRSAKTSVKKDYFLFVGQLINYKRPQLAVEACLKLGKKLIIVGDGDCREELEKRCANHPQITFAGRCENEKLRSLYANAQALIFPGVEDFGIVPLEAQSCGTPVIALGQGGALETVQNGRTGLFFNEPTIEALCDAMIEFEKHSWDADVISSHADSFNPERFRQEIRDFIANLPPVVR